MHTRRDIEIYLKDVSSERLLTWLEQHFGKAARVVREGTLAIRQFHTPRGLVPAIVTAGVDGEAWTSVWFNSPHTPWHTDLDCARQAATELNCETRCESGGRFIHIDGEAHRFVEWTPQT